MISSLLYFIFPALMAFAASYDCLSLRISNTLCLTIAGAFFPAAILIGLPAGEILAHLGCAGAMLSLGFALFAMGWVGGGDAKLFGAAALWFGWERIASFGIAVTIAGGLLALAVLLLRALSEHPLFPFGRMPARPELPYAVALAAGALIVYPQSLWAIGHFS